MRIDHEHNRPQILLVEDDVLLKDVLELALCREGYTVATAGTAQAAIDKAYRLRPEIVLLDIQLPDQSGYLVAAKLRLVKPVPKLLFLTALGRGQSDRMASFLAADGILHKPFSVTKLLARIEALLGLARAA